MDSHRFSDRVDLGDEFSELYIQRRGLNGLALAMLPALVSAMAACTWHLFDNSEALRGLVLLQASLTLLGNVVLALAALQLKRRAAT